MEARAKRRLKNLGLDEALEEDFFYFQEKYLKEVEEYLGQFICDELLERYYKARWKIHEWSN